MEVVRLVSEIGRVFESTKLRVKEGNTYVVRGSMCLNVNRMDVRLNYKPLQEVDCLTYLGWEVVAEGGCERDVVHRMNRGYRV